MTALGICGAPTNEDLQAAISDAISSQVFILTRRPNEYSSTYATEVVTCRLGDGTALTGASDEITILCKYESLSGSRRQAGLAYEAYAHAVAAAPSGLPVPKLLAAPTDNRTGAVWLVYSFIDGQHLTKGDWPANILAGAEWLARFHQRWEPYIRDHALSGLTLVDESWLRAELARDATSLARLGSDFGEAGAWLADRWAVLTDAMIDRLLKLERTVIHGDYYPNNLLISEGALWPVDWGSVAVGPGELDLATLIDLWDEQSVSLATQRYAEVRALARDPDLSSRIMLARLFVQMRWLPGPPRPQQTKSKAADRRMRRLALAASLATAVRVS